MRTTGCAVGAAVTCAAMLGGCQATPWEFYQQADYIEATAWPEDTGISAGDVIRFTDGVPEVLMAADGCADLLRPLQERARLDRIVPGPRSEDTWFTNRRETFEEELGHLIEPGLDVFGSIRDSRVDYVRFELIDGGTVSYSVRDLERRIEAALDADRVSAFGCLDVLEEPRSFLVLGVYEVQGLRVQFLDTKKNPVAIDDRILSRIGASASLAEQARGNLGIEVINPTVLAYSLAELKQLDAFAGDTAVRVHQLHYKEAMRARWGSSARVRASAR